MPAIGVRVAPFEVVERIVWESPVLPQKAAERLHCGEIVVASLDAQRGLAAGGLQVVDRLDEAARIDVGQEDELARIEYAADPAGDLIDLRSP